MPILLKVRESKFTFLTTESMVRWHQIIDSFNNTEKTIEVTFVEHSAITTQSQENLFLALCIEGGKHTGYSQLEFEQLLIDEFAPYKYTQSILGEKVKTRKTVSEMTNKEFNIFIEQSVSFGNDFFNLNFNL